MIAAVLAFAAAALAVLGLAGLVRPRRLTGPRLLRLLTRALAAGRPLRPPPDLDARLAAAGRPAGLGTRELMAAKVAGGAAGVAVGLALAAGAPGRLGSLLVVGAPVAGFLAPDLQLARLARARARRIERELPVLLDLLRVQVEVGGSLAGALGVVGGRVRGPLARELAAVARETALGVPLAEALRALGRRVPFGQVGALAAALERARRHGVPLGETLAAQAAEARFAYARRVREEAARAGPKIQLVVALLLVPSVLLLVAAALAAALLGEGSSGLVPA